MDLEPDERRAFIEAHASSPEIAKQAIFMAAETGGAASASDLVRDRVVGAFKNATPSGPEPLPDRIDQYDIVRRLGRGGMGEVLEGVHPEIGKRVAIKRLPASVIGSGPRQELFLDEARAMAQLEHPNIARFMTHGRDTDDRLYLVMEFVDGVTLADRLCVGPCSSEETVQIGFELASALCAAHEASRPLIHRDLKPGNVMLRETGMVKLLDFGLVRGLASPEDDPHVPPGVAVGTQGYWSPEQARGDPVDARTDLFSFGCVLYECLVGRRLFSERVPESDADLAALDGRCDVRLIDLIRSCVSIRAEDRPHAARVVRDRLDAIASGRAKISEVAPPFGWTESFGRDQVVASVLRHLGARAPVVLTGVGGIGKSHIAMRVWEQAYHRFDRRVFVGLGQCAADSEAAVARAIAGAIGTGQSDASAGALIESIGTDPVLLVLDECEAVVGGAAAFVSEALRRCPGLRVLATSRERLPLPGSRVIEITPLETPSRSDLAGVEPVASVRMFVGLSRLVAPQFELNAQNASDVASLCRLLDGIPLAVELAASSMDLLDPASLLRAYGSGGTVGELIGDARYTGIIETALETSVDRLAPAHRDVFDRLSVFRGGWAAEAARVVCAETGGAACDVVDSGLVELRRRSLIVRAGDSGGRARYRFLEPVRAYAQGRCDRSLGESATRAHVAWFAAKARALETGRHESGGEGRLDEMATDYDNVRRALRVACDGGFESAMVSRFAADLWSFWFRSAVDHDDWRDLSIAAFKLDPGVADDARGALANSLGICFVARQEFGPAREWYGTARSVWESLERPKRIALVLNNVGSMESDAREFEAAEAAFSEAISLLESEGVSASPTADEIRNNMGVLYLRSGRPAQARAEFLQVFESFEASGRDANAALVLLNLGASELELGHDAACESAFRRSYGLARPRPTAWDVVTAILLLLAGLRERQGRDDEAAIVSRLALDLVASIGPLESWYDLPIDEARRRVGDDAGAARDDAARLAACDDLLGATDA